jgi:hypothetical protein
MIRRADAEGIDGRVIDELAKIGRRLRLVPLNLRDLLQRVRQPARVDLGDGYDLGVWVAGKKVVQLSRTPPPRRSCRRAPARWPVPWLLGRVG